jgi:hypothetical protein
VKEQDKFRKAYHIYTIIYSKTLLCRYNISPTVITIILHENENIINFRIERKRREANSWGPLKAAHCRKKSYAKSRKWRSP